jgi:CRP-like cAMP-binding protein
MVRWSAIDFACARSAQQKKKALVLDYAGGNRVLDALTDAERGALLRDSKTVRMERRDPEPVPGSGLSHVDFPVGALMSVVAVFENGDTNEVGVVGRDGFVPIEPVIQEPKWRRTVFCQVAGDVVRVPIIDFQREMATKGRLSQLAQRSIGARLFCAEQLVSCNLSHSVKQRCARWLLMTQDRVGADEFPLTHEFLSIMLGVRRAGVSEAAGALQKDGAIRYHRGRVTIVDKPSLVSASCECYAVTLDAFERALTL